MRLTKWIIGYIGLLVIINHENLHIFIFLSIFTVFWEKCGQVINRCYEISTSNNQKIMAWGLTLSKLFWIININTEFAWCFKPYDFIISTPHTMRVQMVLCTTANKNLGGPCLSTFKFKIVIKHDYHCYFEAERA